MHRKLISTCGKNTVPSLCYSPRRQVVWPPNTPFHRAVPACAALRPAVELAPIRVNTIIPGLVDTPLVAGMFGGDHDQAMAAVGKTLPVGRVGQPEDIADAVLFLMGNGYVTGINLVVDGGRLLV